MVRPSTPAIDVRSRVEAILGRTATWRPVTGGYSSAGIWVVDRLAGASVFVKAATTSATAGFLCDEFAVYSQITAACMPELVAWDDGAEFPVLVIEDLSQAAWPPPWNRNRIDAVLAAAAELAGIAAPDWLPSWAGTQSEFVRWGEIAAEPQPFLATGLASAEWLQAAIPSLTVEEGRLDLGGDAVVHSDIRSDNLCFAPHTKLVDWNWARRGNPRLDVLGWLPSLHLEGGPPPWDLDPDAEPSIIAALAGYFAYYAGLPPSPQVNPDVRLLQRNQADVCLEWLTRLGRVPARS